MSKINGYPFFYETHLHTNQSSACASNSGYEMSKAAHEAGYTGIIVTDHNWGGNTSVNRNLPWKEWNLTFSKGYLDAKSYGEVHDFDVFFGYEAGYNGTEFLIYGVDSNWLIAHPEIKTATVEEQFQLIHESGGMVIHAHPFRDCVPEIKLFPEFVDGVEGINATHSCHTHPEFDDKAIQYANEHHLPIIAGSDIHSIHLLGGGVAFRRRLTSVQDFCKAILSDEDYVLTNGDFVFDKYGNKIGEMD
ncbi:MAG: PHP domain-containing protein [Oliverpabstia sp.]